MEVGGDGGVVAHHDHHRRGAVLAGRGRLRLLEPLLPLAGEGKQGVFDLAVDHLRLRPPPGQPFARLQVAGDVLPQPEVLGVGAPGVVRRGQARNLGDAALDGVDQTEVADDPGERGAFGIAAALQVERRGRQVDADVDAAGGVDPIQPVHPHRGRLALGPRGCRQVVGGGRRAVGVVAFVVEHQQRLAVVQVAQAVARERLRGLLADPSDRHRADADLLGVGAEPVPVGDQHLALGQLRAQRRRHQVELLVVVAGRGRAQHLQPLLDGEVGADHQHAAREARVAGRRAAVAEAPGGEHRHDHGLAAAGRHLAGVARDRPPAASVREVGELGRLRHLGHPLFRAGIAALAEQFELAQREPGRPARLPAPRQQLAQVDDRLRRFELAEEQAPRAVLAPPVAQQLLAGRRRAGPAGPPPAAHVGAQHVHQRQVVPFLLGEQRLLSAPRPLALEPVAGLAPPLDLRRHAGAGVVQPVRRRLGVGRADDRLLDRLQRKLRLGSAHRPLRCAAIRSRRRFSSGHS